MATNAVILVQWDGTLTQTELVPLRETLCRDLELRPEDDFYLEGPLILVPEPNRDYDFALSNGQQIIVPQSSCWLNVNIQHRYYDSEYKHGYFPLFMSIAVWLEERLPRCLLWYGNDCDGILKPFNAANRAHLIAQWKQQENQ